MTTHQVVLRALRRRLGFAKDGQMVVFWFQNAAEQGHVESQMLLASKYAVGDGLPMGAENALYWYRKPAAQGNGDAQNMLDLAYEDGDGVGKDAEAAYFWLLLSSAQGNADAYPSRDAVASQLTTEQIAKTQELVKAWRPKTAR